MTDLQQELTAPDEIDRKFVRQVIEAMQWRNPVSANAIVRCLLWQQAMIHRLLVDAHRISEVVTVAIAELE